MQNWSGDLVWQPNEHLKPTTEQEIQTIVNRAVEAKKNVRIIGSGHSFTALCVTDDILISLDDYQGIVHVNKEAMQVTVKAGTKLHFLSQLLAKEGLAMANMGDIDVQSIAGALSTGTHGTGTAFGNLSTMITKLRFVNGKGEIVTCSEDEHHDIFKAAQVSMGSLGILTEITLQCVPAFKLELVMERKTIDDVLFNLEAMNMSTRNYEFYWFPNTEYCMTKELNETEKPVDKVTFSSYFQEMILENYAFKLTCEMSRWMPKSTRGISRFSAKTISHHAKVGESYQVFSTNRIVRFNEMEYNVPLAAYKDVKKELVQWVNTHNKDVLFPIENRFVKGDDIYLSPAYGRDSAYIAVHVYNKKKYRKYFDAMEAIFKAHDGRPHWGKMHQLTATDLQERYPMYEKFCQIRRDQDPEKVFLSPYLKTLFH